MFGSSLSPFVSFPLFSFFSSHFQAGQLKLNYSRQNVCDVVEAAAMLCYDMAVSKGLALSWFVDPSLPPSLMLDATRLQQVLLNCLLNNRTAETELGKWRHV